MRRCTLGLAVSALVFLTAPASAQTFPGAEWEAGDPRALGWSPAGLDGVRALADSLGSAALMIVTGGRVVLAHGDTGATLRTHSIRKSVMSALYGIYLAEGKVDTAATLAALGIDEKTPLTAGEKRARVADLLRARSGVYLPAAAEVQSMRDARPARGSHAPGTHWYYNNWDFNALGTIFERATGEGIFPAFQRRIAAPLGMQDFDVEKHGTYGQEEYSVHRSYAFRLSARDLARFGLLYLHGGRWAGRQVVPAEWVAASTRVHSATGDADLNRSGYGFMWWTHTDEASDRFGVPRGSYTASGVAGQKVTVLPALNTVVVHRVDTDVRPIRFVRDPDYDRLLQRIVAARAR